MTISGLVHDGYAVKDSSRDGIDGNETKEEETRILRLEMLVLR